MPSPEKIMSKDEEIEEMLREEEEYYNHRMGRSSYGYPREITEEEAYRLGLRPFHVFWEPYDGDEE